MKIVISWTESLVSRCQAALFTSIQHDDDSELYTSLHTRRDGRTEDDDIFWEFAYNLTFPSSRLPTPQLNTPISIHQFASIKLIPFKMNSKTLSILLAIFGITAQHGALAMPAVSTMTMYDDSSATQTTTMTTSVATDTPTATVSADTTSLSSVFTVNFASMSSSAIMSVYSSATSSVMDDMMSSMSSAMGSAMDRYSNYLTYADYYVSVNAAATKTSGKGSATSTTSKTTKSTSKTTRTSGKFTKTTSTESSAATSS